MVSEGEVGEAMWGGDVGRREIVKILFSLD